MGAGSIGCLYAAYLQRAGIATTLLLRDQSRLQQFHDAGLTLQLDDTRWPVPIAAQIIHPITAMPPITHLLLGTKAHHSVAAIAAIKPALAANATIVLLPNGMGVREELRQVMPQASLIHAISTEGAWQPQRFHVVHAGHGETFVGAVPAGDNKDSPAAANFAADLHRSGLNAHESADIEPRLWQKLAVNCVINPLTALHRCPNGALLQLPGLPDQLDAVCREITAVAAASGVTLDADQLREKVIAVIHATAANRSSMLQDIEAGRVTEIDYVNGFVVRRAQHYRIECPANRYLLTAIKALEAATIRQI